MSAVSVQAMILELMRYNAWDQQEFAKHFGCDPAQVSRWLAGKATPRGNFCINLKEEYDKLPAKFA